MRSKSAATEHARTPVAVLDRRYLVLAALLYTAFVVYGSLVPLEFRALPLDEALARRWVDVGVGSRADWAANVLLTIPLAFLWLGVLSDRRSITVRVIASVLVFLAAAVFSFAVEFTQIYFSQRTPSKNDLFAQALGTLGGILVWWALGSRVAAWLGAWIADRGESGPWQRLLRVYVVALFGYNLLPLDLTINPVEIYHKFSAGRVVWLPFSGLPADGVQAFYETVTDIVIWIPVAALWRAGGLSAGSALRRTVALAFVLECLQVFVYSRVSDVTDVLSALLGGWLGVLLTVRLLPAARTHARAVDGCTECRAFVLGALGVIAYCAVLAAVFWYPFDFDTSAHFLRERVALLLRAPFTSYYYGTEFRAVTSALQKFLFFMPLGFLLACTLVALGWRRGAIRMVGLGAVALIAALVEGAQLALPDKVADLADWMLATAGGALGVELALMILRQRGALLGSRDTHVRPRGAHARPRDTHVRPRGAHASAPPLPPRAGRHD